MRDVKRQLYELCQAYIAKRIETAQQAIEDAQASANEETKSSAGDKYETGRAMMQLEMEKLSAQLSESLKLKHTLDQIKVENDSSKVQPGSIVLTSEGNFFMAISAGQFTVSGITFNTISLSSPLGLKLKGLSPSDSVVLNNRTFHIKEVW